MKDILHELYNGKINFVEDIVAGDRKYQSYLQRQVVLSESLLKSLSPQQKVYFERYQECVGQTHSYLEEKVFRKAFIMAISLILEVQEG
ncbi:MAG: DUF6809 family protein [Faecalispora sporosphaeroides]|uniref:DUF6809 family protein n=1 Tax=Faecalispora sporosphaeroides TaxID=1549 RepID=UPI0039952639